MFTFNNTINEIDQEFSLDLHQKNKKIKYNLRQENAKKIVTAIRDLESRIKNEPIANTLKICIDGLIQQWIEHDRVVLPITQRLMRLCREKQSVENKIEYRLQSVGYSPRDAYMGESPSEYLQHITQWEEARERERERDQLEIEEMRRGSYVSTADLEKQVEQLNTQIKQTYTNDIEPLNKKMQQNIMRCRNRGVYLIQHRVPALERYNREILLSFLQLVTCIMAGAAIGSLFPGLGTLIGACIGLVVGVGFFVKLNWDCRKDGETNARHLAARFFKEGKQANQVDRVCDAVQRFVG